MIQPDAEPTLRGPAPGQRVFGRYILRALLGRGGMGVVWRAHDEKLSEEIALKFLPEALRWDPGAFEDLKAETRRARQLTHPNIIRVHDFVEDAAGAAIAMELVDGRTLTALRLEKDPQLLAPADITPWLPQLCAALDHAHRQARVVHRDLKPTNILLARDGTVKVGDFGIARSLADSITRVSMMSAGTLVYMSPQQAMGDEPSPADDIYALGATLYELLTGKPPFHTGDVRLQLFQRSPDSIAARRRRLHPEASLPEIPAVWEKTLAACLEKRAECRPATAGEVASRLMSERPATVARPAPPGRPAGRARPKWRRLAVAALLAVAIGAAVVFWKMPRPAQTAGWASDAARAVGAWNFDGNGEDGSGHGFDVINAASAVPTRDRHGRIDRALHFNGVAAIETPDVALLRWGGAEPFSISIWLRPDAFRPAGNHIIGSAPARVGDPQWQLGLAENGEVRLFLGLFQEPGGVGLTGSRVRAGEWAHVAVVSDGETARLFVDSNPGAEAVLPGILRRPAPHSARLRLGTSDLYARSSFSGDLDELRVWRRALAAAEVASLAAREAPPRFTSTRGTYSDRDDLPAAIAAEFGPGATLADWDDLRRWRADDAAALGRELGLEVGATGLLLQRAGQRLWQAPRHYLLSRFAGVKPDYFLAHDELGGFRLALGSWYDVRQRALVRLPPQPLRSEMLPRAAGARLIARSFGAEDHLLALAATWRGALTRDHGEFRAELHLRDGRSLMAVCAPLPAERLAISLGGAPQPEIARQIGATLGDFQFALTVADGWLRFRAVALVGGAPIFQEQLPLAGVRAEDIAELVLTGMEAAELTWESPASAAPAPPPASAPLPATDFGEDFDSGLNGWVRWGVPLPRTLPAFQGRTNVLDNNGDGMHWSGLTSTSLFSAPQGFALTADVLLNVTNPAGCHLSAYLGLTRDAANWMDPLGARGDSGEGVRMGLDFVGDACWDMPAEQMRHAWVMASYLAEDGTSVSIHEELPLAARAADVWTNRWATLKIVVSADRSVRFLVDEHEVWAPRKKLHPAVLERQRIVMDGQSLGTAGKAYHDALRWHAVGEGRREVVPPVAAFAPQTLPWQAEAWRFIGENGSARDLVAAEDGSCTLASGRAESRQEFARPLAVSFELTPWLQSSGRGADRLRVGFVSGEQFAGVECQGGEIWLADGTGGTSHRVARLGTYAAGTLLALTLIVDDAGMLEAVGSGIIARRVSLRLPEGPWRIYIAATDTTDGVRVRPVGVGSSSRENR